MKLLKSHITFCLFVLTTFASAQTVKIGMSSKTAQHSQIISDLDGLFERALAEYNVPGMAVAIVKDGEVLLSKGYGVRLSGSEKRVDDNTQFAIASNSKAFTSAALAILVDEGKIKWDDKVRTYLPYFELYSPYVSDAFTIRDLLCHRSGLATFSGDLLWYGTTHSREEVIRRAKYLKPIYGFRESYGYSNIMFLAAGEIVAKVSGQSWDDFVKQHFFQPLGMTHSNTTVRDLKMDGNVAMPHNDVNGKNVAIDYVNWDNINAAGSINSSVSDISNWIKLQLGKGTFNGQKIWNEQRSYEMWENLTPKPVGKWQRENMPSRHFNGYGLGWDLMEYGGFKVISHGGGYDGMISKTVLVPELNLGFVILTNNINSLPSCLTFEILDEYCKIKDKKDWTAMFLGFKKDDEAAAKKMLEDEETARKKDSKPSLPLSEYCGTYSSEMYGDVVIKSGNSDNLVIDFIPTALFKGTLDHWQYDTFQLSWTTQMMLPKGKATFVLDANGRPIELRVIVENPDFDFTELVLKRNYDQ
jgi:CubicO group peptidase (beta-lactamase class C family)